ncbi:MAG: hypothetical protein PWP58_528 [Bacillota bacterium]|jgi:hypothetical protein|nr:hypothetical protein [Bacillota bacterium]
MCRTSIPEQDICQDVDAISPTAPQRTLQSIKRILKKGPEKMLAERMAAKSRDVNRQGKNSLPFSFRLFSTLFALSFATSLL